MARKSYSPEFKLAVVLEALKERKTLQKIASENRIAPSQISRWVDEFKSAGISVFSKDMSNSVNVNHICKKNCFEFAKFREWYLQVFT